MFPLATKVDWSINDKGPCMRDREVEGYNTIYCQICIPPYQGSRFMVRASRDAEDDA